MYSTLMLVYLCHMEEKILTSTLYITLLSVWNLSLNPFHKQYYDIQAIANFYKLNQEFVGVALG